MHQVRSLWSPDRQIATRFAVVLCKSLGKEMFEYLRVTEEGALPSLAIRAPFKCIVVIEASVSAPRQMQISRWLVGAGCLYMMAWGPGCSSWDDSVDIANLEQFNFDEIPEESFVMTTWHESEPLHEVFEFARQHVSEFRSILVLQINGPDREQEFRKMIEDA